MKTLRQILATTLLALVLGIPTYAGDMSGPSSAPSPPPPPTAAAPSVTETLSETVPVATDSSALTVMALDFLVSALSMY